ncbi:TrmB family transcriptional regulator [Candidatus Woesearchaeota archaeon]|nr:TrmB family transcriptional regulator [Candidatus Woesearchaeota archaeon]
MIVKEELLSKLRRYFSLNLYEARIWTALLSRGVSTAGELSDIGHVPRSRAYDVLESLEKKGYVVMKLGKPIKYIAVDPKEVVERVKKSIQVEANQNIDKLKELNNNEVITELDQLHKNGIEFIDASDLSGAIKGKHNLYAHLETLIKNAEKSVTLVTTEKGLIRKVEALKPVLQKLNKKGVTIRVAAPLSKESLNAVKELKSVAEVKDSGDLNARFCVVDGKDLMFMLMHDEEVHPTYDVGVWVNTPFFASALENMFNLAWKDLEPASKKLKL